VSFLGFIFVGPAVLIGLRVYLQIYAEHWRRLEAIRRRLPSPPRAPALAPLRNPLVRGFAGFVLYLLLPLAMLAFTWKAAVFPAWGAGLFCATAAVVMGHVVLPLRRSWRVKTLLSLGAAFIAAAIVFSQGLAVVARVFQSTRVFQSRSERESLIDWQNRHFFFIAFREGLKEGLIHRPFNLFRADLSNQSFRASDLRGAFLHRTNLTGSDLLHADLAGADLGHANLAGTDLRGADLAGADLSEADLTSARLESADFPGASLRFANLAGQDLMLASFAGADLAHANLADTDLRGADLTDALLSSTRFAGEGAEPARYLTQAQINGAFAWADQPPVGLDRLDPPLALPETRLCDRALHGAWVDVALAAFYGDREEVLKRAGKGAILDLPRLLGLRECRCPARSGGGRAP
jgi:uncharacterized protein YjbI with pentapeptide repeats